MTTALPNREYLAAVRREKELDARARAQLIARYGAVARGPRGGPRLERRAGAEWRCPACGRASADARRVCGHCLAPEPGARPAHAAQATQAAGARPGRSEDPAVRLMTFPHGRCYRIAERAALDAEKEKQRANETVDAVVGDAHDESRDTGDSENASVRDEDGAGKDKEAPKPAVAPRADAGHSSSRRPAYTHFVALPIGRLEAVRPNAAALMDELRGHCSGEKVQIPEEVVSVAPRLHFTLLMLALPTDELREAARACMQTLHERLRGLPKERLCVRLSGVHVMPGRGCTVARTKVVYMGFHDNQSKGNVQALQKMVHECFAELLVNDSRWKKESKLLHMTLMNSKWMDSNSHGAVFNATEIMSNMKNATLCGCEENGAIQLEYIDLNERKYDHKTGSYACMCSVEL